MNFDFGKVLYFVFVVFIVIPICYNLIKEKFNKKK